MNGCYRHSVDNKGRLFMPAKLREALGDVYYAARGLDNCVAVYSAEVWKELESKVNGLPLSRARHMQRMFFGLAQQCEPDAQGRISIPQKLRDYAFIDKEAVVVGVSDRVEIWSAKRWDELESNTMTAENLAAAMDELGI
ncbi:MAG: division/cell wall cluster transcriptional repressor MraZ [Oscillospiraceae bacterium]|nr:division/cell wall cluster transcriptional repressor MraZ [Oscillospiraceae bacterium]